MSVSCRGLPAASAASMRVAAAAAQGIAPRRGGTLTTILRPEPAVLQIGVNIRGRR